jgi:putative flippase GtrA
MNRVPFPSSEARAEAHWLGLVLRHQLGSIVATLVDFGTMIVLVSGFGMPPVGGTVVGAAAGAVTNFLLGRRWIFRAQTGDPSRQAARYAFTWAGSLSLNAFGMWVGHDLLGIQYIVTRAVIAVGVSLAWNFPMQRFFVFQPAKEERP